MKILLSIFVLASFLFGAVIQSGENLSQLKWNDQFDKEIKVQKDTKKLIVVFSKEKGAKLKEFFDQNKDYLKYQNAFYLADVSAAPSLVTSMFMIPKFKDYSFSMGVIRDEDFAKKFPKKEGMITIINLEEFVVTSIEFKNILP